MNKLRCLAVACLIATSIGAWAIPAKRTTFVATQPDGTQVTLTRAGDEFNKYYLTDDQQVVVGNKADGYYFATVDAASGRITASTVQASDAANRTEAQKAYVAAINIEELDEAMATTSRMSRIAPAEGSRSLAPRKAKASLPAQSGYGLFPNSTYPTSGSPKALIILVQYTDVKFSTAYDASDYFTNLLSKKGFNDYGGTGSVLDWFTDASMGQFTPDFDVYGPVTLSRNQAYYGGNDIYGDDLHPEQMVVEGCRLLDSQVDFSDYDTDGDGYVDNVYIYYAGLGEADYGDEDTVWPHSWNLSEANTTLTLDGVRIETYACSNESDGVKPDGIGTFVHEFSHVLGLPDLYHTKSNATYTPGAWSVMDYGPYNNDGRTPPTYSIFERNAFGWIDPIVLDQSPRSVELNDILTSNEGCLIPTYKTSEFFLLENRQQTSWDKYLPGHGMLIWHIDYNSTYWSSNTVNNTKGHQYVDIEEANNNPNSSSTAAMKNYAFPGTTGAYTSFTDTTTPNMKTWSGTSLNTPITNITESNGVISFDVCGGGTAIDSPVALQPTSDQIGNDYFLASWNAVEGAADYLLTVKTLGEATSATYTSDFGSGKSLTLPEGWSANSAQAYSSSGNYGEASPALRLDKAGQYIQSPKCNAPITKIQFWAKGQSQTDNTATLYAVDGGTDTFLTTFSDWDTKTGNTKTYAIDASKNVTQVKLVYNKEGMGNLAIDDIVITSDGNSSETLPNYDGVSTNGATSMRVDNLPAGKTDFVYTVVAVAADGSKSSPSNAIAVELNMAGVDSITADDSNAPVEYYNLQGVRVANPGKGIYLRRQGTSVVKVIK